MLIVAMAPPLPLGSKLFLALLMLGVIGLLRRVRSGRPFTGQSIVLAIAVTAGAVVLLEGLLPRQDMGGFHELGLLAAFVGAFAAARLLRYADDTGEAKTSNRQHLAAITFVTGPLIGLVLALLTLLFTNVLPLDRVDTIGSFVAIGVVAGLLGAGLVTFAIR